MKILDFVLVIFCQILSSALSKSAPPRCNVQGQLRKLLGSRHFSNPSCRINYHSRCSPTPESGELFFWSLASMIADEASSIFGILPHTFSCSLTSCSKFKRSSSGLRLLRDELWGPSSKCWGTSAVMALSGLGKRALIYFSQRENHNHNILRSPDAYSNGKIYSKQT